MSPSRSPVLRPSLLVLAALLILPAAGLGAQIRTVRVGMLPMPPIIDPELPDNGFTGALLKAVFEPQGWQVQMEVAPWARVFAAGKAGLVDAVWPSIKTEERAEWFLFTDVGLVTKYALLARKDHPLPFKTLADLKPYTIGTLRGGVTGSDLDKRTDLRLEPATDFSENIKKVLAGRIDAMTAEYFHVKKLLKTEFPDEEKDLQFLDPPLSVTRLHLMVSKKSSSAADLVAAFNKGLRALQASGEYDRLLEKFGMK